MADSKIDFSFENLHFACSGDNAWVEKQLNNVLSRIPALLAVHKKGENMVEEVIDVQEFTSRPSRPKKSTRTVKTKKVVAAPKEMAAMEEKVEAPKVARTPKAPKVKAPKVPKAAKIPKEKTVKVAKVKPSKVPKVKAPKLPKEKKIGGLNDSPLFQFLAEKKAEKNQVRKFLATAVYLAQSNDQSKLSTLMISKALKSFGIEKLLNPSDCLNKNEKKGYCVKEGKIFTITENGFLSVG